MRERGRIGECQLGGGGRRPVPVVLFADSNKGAGFHGLANNLGEIPCFAWPIGPL